MAETTFDRTVPVGRREFLLYIWGASMALALAGSGGAVLWYAYPRFREGEFGGEFPVAPSLLPPVGAAPEDHAEGRFWLINTDEGVLAIYKVCTHLGCLYKWVPSNDRFECPCHGSKFTREGVKIDGPAPRNLDRFVMRAVDAEGNMLAEAEDGSPLVVPDGAAFVRILTGERTKGEASSE